MVRNYKKKLNQCSYGEEKLREALEKLKEGGSLIGTSRKYSILARTLRRHRDGKVTRPGTPKLEKLVTGLPTIVENVFPKEKKCLLILDGHHSHKSINAINYCRDNGIEMLTLPPHCTHKMQPLDRTYFKLLNTAYNRSCDHWPLSNPGQRMTIHDIAGIFSQSFLRTAVTATAVNGFKTCGLWPYDSDIFTDEDFAPSLITDEVETPSALANLSANNSTQEEIGIGTEEEINLQTIDANEDEEGISFNISLHSVQHDNCILNFPSTSYTPANNELEIQSSIKQLVPLPKTLPKRCLNYS